MAKSPTEIKVEDLQTNHHTNASTESPQKVTLTGLVSNKNFSSSNLLAQPIVPHLTSESISPIRTQNLVDFSDVQQALHHLAPEKATSPLMSGLKIDE